MTSHDELKAHLDDLGGRLRPSEGFAADVMRRLTRMEEGGTREGCAPGAVGEINPPDHPVVRRAIPRFWRMLVPAAAAVAAMAALAWVMLPGTQVMAWDDVVQAMQRVRSFQVTAFNDDPRRADESRRLFKIEIHHRAPDQWRAQGLGHVQFLRGRDARLYSVEKRAFVDPTEARLRMIPSEFVAEVGRGDLLGAILASMFDGKPPEGKPVRSDVAAEADGIEVFDYARDPADMWARIWVLRASRLPMRIKLFHPTSDGFMLLTFDYTDGQPESYFNPDHFERVIKEYGLTRDWEILRAGAQPISGKPTDPGHVHEMLGDYKAADVVSVAGNADGAMMIEHTSPTNVAPRGGAIADEGYETPTDNWGNVYYSTGGFKPCGGNWRLYYVPLPEFKRGEGERVVRLTYALTAHEPIAGTGRQRRTSRVLATQDVVVPLDTPDRVPEKARADYWSDAAWRQARLRYMTRNAPALAQWRYLQEQLARQPEDPQLLAEAYELLRRHGRQEQADELASQRLLPTFMRDPIGHEEAGFAVGQHLKTVARSQGAESVMPVARQLTRVWQEAQALKPGSRRQNAEYLFEELHSPLGCVVRLPQAMAAFEAGPKPRVIDVVRGRDGRIVLRAAMPPMPSDRGAGDITDIWPMPVSSGDQWKLLATHQNGNQGRVAWLLEPSDAGKTPATIEMLFHPYILGRGGRGMRELQTRWTLEAAVPASPSVDSAADWWAAEVSPQDSQARAAASPFDTLHLGAIRAYQNQQWETAAQLYMQILDMPKENWPEYWQKDEFNSSRSARQALLKARIHLGQLEAVLADVGAAEAALPPIDADSSDYETMHKTLLASQSWRSVRLEAVRYLISRDRLAEAVAMIEAIGRDRPDPSRFTTRCIEMPANGGHGWTMFVPNHTVRETWREYDTVAWDLEELRSPASSGAGGSGQRKRQ